MGCCKDNDNNKSCLCPSANIIKGLKSKLLYQSCDLTCTPADRCECEDVLEYIRQANEWIDSLPGDVGECNDG
tara:strand:+ start:166 stop:384 length:219 start_codon:yes stop_codon:yes gene_type:complete